MSKKLGKILTVIGVSFLLWVFISWVDINNHNDPFNENYQDYSSWNYFTLVFGEGDNS